MVGIILLLSCVVVIAVSKETTGYTLRSGGEMSVYIPIAFALLQTLFFTSSSFLSRYLSLRGYPSLQFTADLLFIYGFSILILFLNEHFYGEPYTWA